jgi:hypothetical protein
VAQQVLLLALLMALGSLTLTSSVKLQAWSELLLARWHAGSLCCFCMYDSSADVSHAIRID